MKVHLTFDIEVWCNGWLHLDRDFPAAFDRYVYGRSKHGAYALPETLAILQRHGLRGVFFVEPLFAARFGEEFLGRIVRMIEDAGQDVQLHLHPEWTNEISPPPIADASRKRQHLCHYTRAEQTELIAFGLHMLRRHAHSPVFAFRAGSYAANLDTYHALAANGLCVDSSLNSAFEISGADIPERQHTGSAFRVGAVQVVPVTVFRDGLQKLRPAQVGACGLQEMKQTLQHAQALGRERFVFVSHNFELLKPGKSEPDMIVVRRFEGLCRHLAERPERYHVCDFDIDDTSTSAPARALPQATRWATLGRLGAQALRRLN